MGHEKWSPQWGVLPEPLDHSFSPKFFFSDGLNLKKFNDKFTAVQCQKTDKYDPDTVLDEIPSCKKRNKKSKQSSSEDDSD
jgi:hypothetical protein